MARSVRSPVPAGARAISVGIAYPAIRQRVERGTIVAKRGRSLTIPVSQEACRRTAETLEHELGITQFRVPSDFGNGLPAVAMSNGRIKAHYMLRRRVDQETDLDAIPSAVGLIAALVLRAQQWWNRVTRAK